MGWYFDLRHASLAGWLTFSNELLQSSRPELDKGAYRHLLQGLTNVTEHPELSQRLIINDHQWLVDLQRTAQSVRDRLGYDASFEENLRNLEPFRQHWGNLHLYALVAEADRDTYPTRTLVRQAAQTAHGRALFMIPRLSLDFEVFSPFPPLGLLADELASWPGVLFWTPSGAAFFCSLTEAEEILPHILVALSSGNPAEIESLLLNFSMRKTRPLKLLHLSDLHFGTQAALRSQGYLATTIKRVASDYQVKKVVITGDLFENPSQSDALQFNFFRQTIHENTGHDPIVVPGNHDQKLWGNFRWSLAELADLEWSNIVIDDDLGLVFLCFDSSRDAELARGCVNSDQRLSVATALDVRINSQRHVGEYLRVALLHHHPISFRSSYVGYIGRILDRFNIDEESFLAMRDGEDFLKWCASRNTPLVLHGHKHVPFHASMPLFSGSRQLKEVSVIGCGSSTGVERCPLSINLLSYDPKTGRWSASFFIDPGDGRGFQQRRLVARRVRPCVDDGW